MSQKENSIGPEDLEQGLHLTPVSKEEVYAMGQPTDRVPHTVEMPLDHFMNGDRAEALAPGVTLFTKDGSALGNAIVVAHAGAARDYESVGEHPLMLDVWTIETDFGNRTRLDSRELLNLFELGFQTSYDRWWEDRWNSIQRWPRVVQS